MKWYYAARDFLFVHPWLHDLIFGSLLAITGGGSFLHRRTERKHAKDLVDANGKIAEAEQEANKFRKEANRLNGELLRVQQDLAARTQPEKEKIRPRLLQHKDKRVMFLRESYRGEYGPDTRTLVDVNEDSVILQTIGPGSQPQDLPLTKITTETDAQGRLVVVFNDGGIRPRR